ncbi:MAG: glycyl-radical enzyme activating protein [Desulfobacterales bacterium]|nr:glycyl-radical enzyme activating protein [Desulfobacterales bacterium]
MNGIIFDIQHYSVYDGPGIRTCVFLKGCPLRCAWCHNPESQKPKAEISYFKDRCAGCGRCVDACPNEAITLTKKGVVRDNEKCTACAECVTACENGAMEKIGKEVGAEEIAEIVAGDKLFYDNSGGGVTISGGEPTMQAGFLFSLLQSLKNRGIHTAIETCGFFKEALIREIIDLTDLFLFDIKHMNQQVHKKFTGVSNQKILSNFEKILARAGSERIIPRIPLIPGFNTDPDSIDEIIMFLQQILYHGPVHLMPYNKMAKTKYEKIGRGHLYQDMGELSDERIDAIIKEMEGHSFHVVCNR